MKRLLIVFILGVFIGCSEPREEEPNQPTAEAIALQKANEIISQKEEENRLLRKPESDIYQEFQDLKDHHAQELDLKEKANQAKIQSLQSQIDQLNSNQVCTELLPLQEYFYKISEQNDILLERDRKLQHQIDSLQDQIEQLESKIKSVSDSLTAHKLFH